MTPILPAERPRLSPRARLQTDRVTGKPIVLYPEGVLVLNPSGHAIATLCTGNDTLTEIVAKLSVQFGVSPATLLPQVTDFLDRLRSKNLLAIASQAKEET